MIWVDSQAPDHQSQSLAWAAAILLVLPVLALNAIAHLIALRFGGALRAT